MLRWVQRVAATGHAGAAPGGVDAAEVVNYLDGGVSDADTFPAPVRGRSWYEPE